MSDRKSILASEEGASTPGSPLRRSTRIANSPAPAAASTTSATISRRRSSATEAPAVVPAKITRRQSLSHEITLEKKPQTPTRRAAAKTPRASSKSPSVEPELKEASAGTPAKRGRRSSITKVKEEEAAARPETPTRRRSVRAPSTSPSKDSAADSQVAKPRGRRASITQASLEVIKETDANAEPKTVGRPTRTTRRTAMDATEETDAKKEEKKPATRRSIRGRSASVDIPEEPEVAPTPELIPINEETEVEEKSAETTEKKTAEVSKNEEKKPGDLEGLKDKKKTDAEDGKVVNEIKLSEQKIDAEVEEVTSMKTEAGTATPEKTPDSSSLRKSRKSTSDSTDKVFKSPVRRSPRLSGSPITVLSEAKSSPTRSATPETKVVDSTQTAPPVSPVVPLLTSPKKVEPSPRKSPRLSESQSERDADPKPRDSPRRSLRLSESHDETNVEKIEASRSSNVSLRQLESESEIITLSEDDEPEQDVLKENISASKDIENREDASKPRRSTRLSENVDVPDTTATSERRKSNSFSDNENKNTSISRLSLGESNILNTVAANSKTPSKDADAPKCTKVDSFFKCTPEFSSGTDGSFRLNLSIPSSNSFDLDEDPKSKATGETVLDVSGSSNNSDKENGDQLNVVKSPKPKRISLSETSTPKLDKSVKLQSLCDPVDVEVSTEVVVATAQVVPNKTPVTKVGDAHIEIDSKTSQDESIIEVDNEDEFGTSPIKPLKKSVGNVTQSEDDLEDVLMSSFVDEVIDSDVEKKETKDKNKKSSPRKEVVLTEAAVKQNKSIEKLNTSVEKPSNTVEKTEETPKKEVALDSETINLDSDSDENVNVSEDVNAEKEKPIAEATGGSKRRKISPSVEISTALDNFINAKLKQAQEESDGDDDDYEPANELIDDMAEEGEEDTPSEDSNQIVDEGESLHSSESDEIEDDDDYENDSFITDEECHVLLSGNEFDLDELDEMKKKRKKSRIIQNIDSSDEEETKNTTKKKDVGKKSLAGKEENDGVADKGGAGKVVILQDIKITPPAKQAENDSVVINEEDDLKSLESMKDTLNVEVFREPKPSLSTPNNSMNESPTRKLRRKTSITIQDEIKISRLSDGAITDKINKAVDFFVSSIKEKSGNVSVNVSLDYANNSASSADEGTPKKKRMGSMEVENINDAVDQILQMTVNESNADGSAVKKKRNSNVLRQNVSLQDEFEVEDQVQNTSALKMNKIKKRDSQGFVEVEVIPEAKSKEKGKMKRLSGKDLSFTLETDVKLIKILKGPTTIEVEPPKKKLKLSKSLSDDDAAQDVKTKKSRKERRQSANKSWDAVAVDLDDVQVEPEVKLPSPVKKSKRNKKSNDEQEEVEFMPLPSKKGKVEEPKDKKPSSYLIDMLVEDEPNPRVTKAEVTYRHNTKSVTDTLKRKLKKVKPSKRIDHDDTWNVQVAMSAKPSKSNKVSVKDQLQAVQKKLAANDFKNQMIFGSRVERMDSKDIVKNKQKAGFVARKQKK